MKTTFTISATFSVPAKEIYEAWLDGEKHTAMTGGEATGQALEDSTFTAWDGYISGRNIRLVPYSEIKQSWRTTEFEEDAPDSYLHITLMDTDTGCQLSLTHTDIPEGQPDYKTGWTEHYFEPMKVYFSE